jgi:transcription elongation factor GreA-like protein
MVAKRRKGSLWGCFCRMQFNQNAGIVEVQVFVKQLQKQRDRVKVDIQESLLKVEIKDADLKETEYSLEEKLYQPIVVAESKWDVWSTQVNIKLKKADPAIVWPDLAYSDAPVRHPPRCSREQ